MKRMKLTNAGFKKRFNRIKKMYSDIETKHNVNNLHVKLQPGNTKTGKLCYTVSLLPIFDCTNCDKCHKDCYDFAHDLVFNSVTLDRIKNSLIHLDNPERYWNEISIQIKANYIQALRINVGGDLKYEDFIFLNKVAEENPKCQFLFFTKTYDGINRFLDEYGNFCDNVHPIMSTWKDLEMSNPHKLPTSHVLFEDGSTTAPKYGAVYCQGNCSKCLYDDDTKGCWDLKNGESVIFPVH